MKCLRIYADETGESHLADIDIPLVPVELFPPISSSRLYHFAGTQHSAGALPKEIVRPSSVIDANAGGGASPGCGLHPTRPSLETAVYLSRYWEFESISLEQRVCELSSGMNA
jgi:hypothetical protein